MRRLGLLAPLLLLAATGCWRYRAGYCEQSHRDCGPGFTCHPETHLCLPAVQDAASDTPADTATDATSSDAPRDVGADKGPPPCMLDGHDCDGATPVCDTNLLTCRGCKTDDECAALDGNKPACLIAADGGTTGTCVPCTSNKHCPDTAPVCDPHTNRCGGCITDDDCKLYAPGVCKTTPPSAADAGVAPSRCLRDDEAIYVNSKTDCSDTPPAPAADGSAPDGGVLSGTSARPFCTMEPVRGALSEARPVVVVSGSVSGASWSYGDQAGVPITIVGKTGTIIGAASPAFQMSSGDVTIRSLTVKTGGAIGLEADGGTLRLDQVTVTGCQGGIWLNGANFDLHNVWVTGNTAGDHDGFDWGGILETAVPPTGLKTISQVTVANNTGQGITCKDALDGGEILAYGNQAATQVSGGCGLMLCTDAGAMCGARP